MYCLIAKKLYCLIANILYCLIAKIFYCLISTTKNCIIALKQKKKKKSKPHSRIPRPGLCHKIFRFFGVKGRWGQKNIWSNLYTIDVSFTYLILHHCRPSQWFQTQSSVIVQHGVTLYSIPLYHNLWPSWATVLKV